MPRYYMLNRPPDIGTHPKGETAREVWLPRKDIPDTERPAYGWIEYETELEPYEIWRYEMYPADEYELSRYNVEREKHGW